MANDLLDILKHGYYYTYKGASTHNEINISLFFMLLNIVLLSFFSKKPRSASSVWSIPFQKQYISDRLSWCEHKCVKANRLPWIPSALE